MDTPLQNRVTPWGTLEAVSARGTWMGNRGILHDDRQEIVAAWRHKAWVTCRLDFKGRKRTVFGTGTYSELFFLDEATAFSAGHRPCGACRRDRYREFKTAWCAANKHLLQNPYPPIRTLDAHLHAERVERGMGKRTYGEKIGNLPDGAFVELDGDALLVWRGRLHTWTHSGYVGRRSVAADSSTTVQVLTPKSVVSAFHDGLEVGVHPSAFR